MKSFVVAIACLTIAFAANTQPLMPTPPMGFMSWNYFATNVNEKDLKDVADNMVANGMVAAGYNYIFIDDGWQGGRDNRNNIIADPAKFPQGIKALAGYLHARGMKLGIYSCAAPLTCAGYTGSLNFEQQDAKVFASWGIDYLKYDYCGAPDETDSAQRRYTTIADALRNSGRDIALSVCEWGVRQPWLWAARAGGQLWRTTFDVRDKWINLDKQENGLGIVDILQTNAPLNEYAGPGHWNDGDMLVAGLYGKKGPSGDLGGVGCTDREYQSQMSLWCLVAAPLMVSCDIRSMNAATQTILLNKEIIAIDQDPLGKQAVRAINDSIWNVFVKPLADGDIAVGILNLSSLDHSFTFEPAALGLTGIYNCTNIWTGTKKKCGKRMSVPVLSHETVVFRLHGSKSKSL